VVNTASQWCGLPAQQAGQLFHVKQNVSPAEVTDTPLVVPILEFAVSSFSSDTVVHMVLDHIGGNLQFSLVQSGRAGTFRRRAVATSDCDASISKEFAAMQRQSIQRTGRADGVAPRPLKGPRCATVARLASSWPIPGTAGFGPLSPLGSRRPTPL
jgi:hypothetical protein